MVISILEHLNPNQKQDDQNCKSFALKKKKKDTKQQQQPTTVELI